MVNEAGKWRWRLRCVRIRAAPVVEDELRFLANLVAMGERITFTKSPHANFIFTTLDPFAHPDHPRAA